MIMKTQLLKFVALLFVALLINTVFGQLSRQDATDIVLNSILTEEFGTVNVSVSNTSLTGTVFLIDNDSISCPYPGNWVFFVDDHPHCGWYHNCRYIFVNDQTGNYSIVNKEIFPKELSTEYELISGVSDSTPQMLSPAENTIITDQIEPNDHYFAVIVCVNDDQTNWNDVSLVYNSLIQEYGYKKENVFVHYSYDGNSNTNYFNDLDNDGIDDLDYPATFESVYATFDELAGNTNNNPDIPVLGHRDLLSVFFTDVPVDPLHRWYFWNPSGGGYILSYSYSSVLASKVAYIDCAQMLFTFSINYGEPLTMPFRDFTNPTACENRYIQSVTSSTQLKHSESYITDNQYSEYLFYWAAAVRGIYPDYPYTEPWVTGYAVGSFPFDEIEGFEDHPADYSPDWNSDNFKQMIEAFHYANDQDTWSLYGYHKQSSEAPVIWDLNPFMQEVNEPDVMTLAGYAGDILFSADITVQGNFVIGGPLNLSKTTGQGGLHFDDGSEIYLINPQSIIKLIANFTVYLHSNCTFYGTMVDNKIEISGTLQESSSEDNISFLGLDNAQWGGIQIREGGILSLEGTNNVIQNCIIDGEPSGLTIANSEITNCEINGSTGDINISNCYLINSFINAINPDSPDRFVEITGNLMNGQEISNPGISISGYKNFDIVDNVIQNYSQGISLNYCGSASGTNSITQTDVESNNGTGIRIYNSFANILGRNSSINNVYGLQILNNSSVSIIGNDKAIHLDETNFIRDCEDVELFCSYSSFPYPFTWNAIMDEDNGKDPLVFVGDYYGIPSFNVQRNYWGINFNPEDDLYPFDHFIYLPVWELEWNDIQFDAGEILFNEAEQAIAESNYFVAENKYKEIISEYPTSKCIQASMKNLFSIEEYAGNNYDSLKLFYSTELSIQNDTILTKLSDFLVNSCYIKLQNWPIAIAWFENVIQNSGSYEDSIFAIIDLGYTYWLMENSELKSTYTGTMPQYKFASHKAFEINKDYLLSLLPGDINLSENLKLSLGTLKPGELLQNVPNPFNRTTQIWYKLDREAMVSIKVYDNMGRCIRTFDEGPKQEGTGYVEFSSDELPVGLYFYKLIVNGVQSDSKKMTILK
jgi:tetratricopeptide (TPR) repeat protein